MIEINEDRRMEKEPRPIQSMLKSHRIMQEEEKPIRWSYMKILREHSDLKEFYPEIDPYAEAYRMRDNMWAIFTESLDGAGDPWMYLINGPERAMLIDTSFGLGDLKGLVNYLTGNKELIVVNTHAHPDHCMGNGQFERIYCNEYEVPFMEKKNDPHIWDSLFDENRRPLYTEFDPADLIDFHPFEIIGVPDGYRFDLGQGYEVELVHLPGHSAGMSGFIDHCNRILFSGDLTGILNKPADTPYWHLHTVEALRDGLLRLQPRLSEIEGVFPGHGMLDQSPVTIEYLLQTAEAILKDPQNYDRIRTTIRRGTPRISCVKYIYQGSAVRYSPDNVYYSQDPDNKTCREENNHA